MAVESAHEDEIQRDALRYREIVKNRKLLNDIPRARVAWKARARSKTQPKSPCLKRPSYRWPDTEKVKSNENIKQARSFQGPGLRKGSPEIASSFGKSHATSASHGEVWEMRTKAASFGDQLSIRSNYSSMIESIRKHSDNIDFGLSHRFLPKNLAYENARFDPISSIPLRQSVSIFGDDIDSFLRSLGSEPVNSPQAPLV